MHTTSVRCTSTRRESTPSWSSVALHRPCLMPERPIHSPSNPHSPVRSLWATSPPHSPPHLSPRPSRRRRPGGNDDELVVGIGVWTCPDGLGVRIDDVEDVRAQSLGPGEDRGLALVQCVLTVQRGLDRHKANREDRKRVSSIGGTPVRGPCMIEVRDRIRQRRTHR
jgi:hypothetical protein